MERVYVEHLYQKRSEDNQPKNKKRNNTPHKRNKHGHNPQARAVAEATMFEFTWYGTAKI